jgi:exosortase/archaeosortase family protein
VPVIDASAGGRTKGSFYSLWGGRSETLLRFGLVPLFVVLCFAFPWHFWRAAITAAVIAGLHDPLNPAVPLDFDTFNYGSVTFQIGTSCVALDVFFGSIPLLWQRQRPLGRNLVFFALYFLVLSIINLVRLILTFRLNATGVSWFLAHDVISGFFYFGIWVWIIDCRSRVHPIRGR